MWRIHDSVSHGTVRFYASSGAVGGVLIEEMSCCTDHRGRRHLGLSLPGLALGLTPGVDLVLEVHRDFCTELSSGAIWDIFLWTLFPV